jgi:predicted phage-related endonuclease
MSDAQLIKPDAWHERRARNVGSSEVSALFDAQPAYAMSRFALWHVKAGIVPPPHIDTPRTRAGIMLEDAIAHLTAQENGWEIERGDFCTDPVQPGMSCTTDWEIVSGPAPEGASGRGILECKNIDFAEWKRTWTDGEPPMHILLQLQHQIACRGYEWGVIGGFIGGNQVRAYPYLARPKLIADIRRRVGGFWQSIEDGKPPAVDGNPSATDVLRALFPQVEDDVIDMRGSNSWPVDCAEFQAAAEAKKAAEKRYEAAKNAIILHLQGHKRGWGGGWSVSTAVTPAKPDRAAAAGETIKGRAETRRYTVKPQEINQ